MRILNSAEPQQRPRDACGAHAVGGEQQAARREQAEHLAAAQRVLAEDLQHVGQQRDAGAEQDEPERHRAEG